MVNLAPFIGLKAPSRQSVPCEVLAIEEARVQVATEYPFRRCVLWVELCWIEGKRQPKRHLVPV